MLSVVLPHAVLPPATTEPDQQIPELPTSLVCRILQHVPVRKRLASCALVCRAWAAAAAATPAEIDSRHAYSVKEAKALQDWLAKHGGVVEVLRIRHKNWIMDQTGLQLPVAKFSRLHKLELSSMKAQAAGFSGCTAWYCHTQC
jgi:hypothetical protein